MSAATAWRSLERETGIEPATNSLEGCDSTTELLPPSLTARYARNFGEASPLSSRTHLVRRFGGKTRLTSKLPTLRPSTRCARSGHSTLPSAACHERAALSGESSGGEGRIRTFEAAGATDLQSVAFDRFATSPKLFCRLPSPRPAAHTFQAASPLATKAAPTFPTAISLEREKFRATCDREAWLVTWSWRRDLNPRPADYKSAALPD